jgi:spore coat protein U-like protein
MKKNLIAGLFIAGLGVITTAMPSFAGTATGVLTINATIIGGCVVTPAVLSFGSLSAGSTTSNDSETNINVLCTNGIDPSSISLAPIAVTTGRKLTSGTSTVDYELYTTTARSAAWNANNTVNPDASTSLLTPLTVGGDPLKVYGRVSNVPVGALLGAYAGAETITVNY